MQHFQLILTILGILAILAVLIHGYMVSRKEKLSTQEEADVGNDSTVELPESNHTKHSFEDELNLGSFDDDQDSRHDFLVSAQPVDDHEINFTLDNDQSEIDPVVISAQPVNDENEQLAVAEPAERPQAQPEDFFVFNVAAKEGNLVRGHELLQFFLTAGFRFGEMSIFHRHEHSDGTGPVLFSIANMMKPGVFNLDKIEQFSSPGVSFFLAAPNENINIKKAFDMMLVAVEQMAEEFDCVVLNEQREPLTEQQFRHYHERLLRYI